jgi:cell division protein FtsB
MYYVGGVLSGIVVGLGCKAFFAQQFQGKIRDYQADILKSHTKIHELEARNAELEKRVKELEDYFVLDKLSMN